MPKLMTDPRVTMRMRPVPNHAPRTSTSGPTHTTSRSDTSLGPKRRGKVHKDGKQSAKAKAMCPTELQDFKQVDDKKDLFVS